jgi:hypothetical protein
MMLSLTQTNVTTRTFRFIDRIFYRYLYSQSVGTKLTSGLMDRNNQSKKLSLVIFDMSVSSLVIILQIDLLTDKVRKKKKLYSLHSINISIVEYNISPIEKSCHSISDFFCLLVCLSVNLTYNHKKKLFVIPSVSKQ